MTKPTTKPGKGQQKAKDSKDSGEKIVAQNRSASYNYHILEKMEAGLVLHGTEVKALREGKANIAQYMPGGPWNHEPLGERKLLLHKREIHKFSVRTESKGLTVIPLRIYFRNGRAKVEIALAQGKKSWDRRQDERDKDARREADQALYRNRRR